MPFPQRRVKDALYDVPKTPKLQIIKVPKRCIKAQGLLVNSPYVQFLRPILLIKVGNRVRTCRTGNGILLDEENGPAVRAHRRCFLEGPHRVNLRCIAIPSISKESSSRKQPIEF